MSGVSLADNLFMAFSAVCVTGLSVLPVSHTYSPFGQAVLCVLMQIGGLGIMVLSASVLVLAGRRMRVRSSAVLAQMVDATSLAGLRRTIASIVLYTFAIEGVGALLLYWRLLQHDPDVLAGSGSIGWAAVFHAIAAFCNAGFSNFHEGLVPLRTDPSVAAIIAVLIGLGGLGFPVIDELSRAAFDKLRRRRLRAFSLHTRLALRTSALLLAVMAVAYFALESHASMAALDFPHRITAAIFQSVSCRSGGFNLIDIGAMTQPMLVLTCAAMLIGASPGSTGGGIKTTTFAVLFAGLRAELSGRSPQLLDRAIPMVSIRKAMAVAFLSMLIIFGILVLVLLLEPHEPLALTFEVVSAFTTTGLSTGITPELSVPGKLVITLSMFIGRIGPLTLALAVAVPAQQRAIELPAERVMIG
jgi:trk system potassium uptake protein TrkH